MTEQKEKEKHVFCPYCDSEVMTAEFPFCQACKITIFNCPQCRKPLSRDNKICPHCGAEIKD
ncbi:zinc ribbon domain-containing protein [Chloroflexota bacterium]